MVSLSCTRFYYDPDYKGEPNHKSFYIVDTIQIEDPVRIFSKKFGGPFVCDRSKLKEYKENKDFFLSPDVFILGFDIYYLLRLEEFEKYYYPGYGNCEEYQIESKYNDLYVQDYKSKPEFILCLINANYYHIKHATEIYFNIPIKNSKIVYLKLVFPLCK